MSHEMPAAGHGYLWPLVKFDSDGEAITLECCPSNPASEEPIRYLTDFEDSIPAPAFEKTIDEFVGLVLARLDALGTKSSQLHGLWAEVLEERSSAGYSGARRLEARLGFEPGEAPESLLEHFGILLLRIGQGAVDELAPVCHGPQHAVVLAQIEEFASLPGIDAHVTVPRQDDAFGSSSTPWEKGWRLAQMTRDFCGLNGQPVSDQQLSELLGIPVKGLLKGAPGDSRPPLGLVIREAKPDHIKLLFRKRNPTALRFEAARFLAEQVLSPDSETWLPTTDSNTARQKTQRAFAAQFLCPINSLREFLDNDFSPESIEAAGDHFGVSELAVKSVLANHHEIPRDLVAV